MTIKSFLNEFELDWASMPNVENEKINILKEKSIVVFGNELARCFIYSILHLNDCKNLGVNVVLVAEDKSNLSDYNSNILLRNDFEFITYNSISELSSVDYVIDFGICSEQVNDVTCFKTQINSVKALSSLCNSKTNKVILVNDCRIYGTPVNNRIYSENEFGAINLNSSNYLATQIMRTKETMWSCFAKQNNFNLTVLRTGQILGASTKLNSNLCELFTCVANKKPYTLKCTDNKNSYIYITDVLKSIIYAIGILDDNKIYNICGINSTVSPSMLCSMLHDIYKCDVSFIEDNTQISTYSPINANKVSAFGCAPSINLETALELCVMSKMDKNTTFILSNTHDGRLSSIQEILLAYLLEVDRICKKHNIKYFLGGGTLLGAIRHKGFIPWDDDADIMMLREDYDKFCSIAKSEMPPSMTFQTNKTDDNCFYEFAKFRLNDTIFATKYAKTHKDMHNGIAFDIFCHDKTANSALGQKIHLATTLFTRALVFNKWNNRKADNGSKLQSTVTNLCKKLLTLKFSMWLEEKSLCFFKNKKNKKFLYDGMGRNIYNGSFPAYYLEEVIYVDFEGYKLPVPKEYDKYLTFLYGDYMELSPISTRLGCHQIELCDIGKYDNFKMNNTSFNDIDK